MKVFILAPTPLVRADLRAVLEEAGIEVTESPEAEMILVSGEELIEDAAEFLSGDGLQSLLVLAEDDDPVNVLRELQLRGWGIIEPDAPPGELVAAVYAVGEGLVVFPRELMDRVLQPAPMVNDFVESLTPREGEVLELLSRGFSNKLIAGELHISEHTVKFHISSLYAKLGVSSRVQAVSQGARHGLISL